MRQKTPQRCARCLLSTEDVRAVQFKRPGKANEYIPIKELVCKTCRDAARGYWRYWR